jgi:hypothetical protein
LFPGLALPGRRQSTIRVARFRQMPPLKPLTKPDLEAERTLQILLACL